MNTFNMLPETCYSTLPSTGELIVIKRGEPGYFRPPMYTRLLENRRHVAEIMNSDMGVTEAQEKAMLVGALVGWDNPGADPLNYCKDGEPIAEFVGYKTLDDIAYGESTHVLEGHKITQAIRLLDFDFILAVNGDPHAEKQFLVWQSPKDNSKVMYWVNKFETREEAEHFLLSLVRDKTLFQMADCVQSVKIGDYKIVHTVSVETSYDNFNPSWDYAIGQHTDPNAQHQYGIWEREPGTHQYKHLSYHDDFISACGGLRECTTQYVGSLTDMLIESECGTIKAAPQMVGDYRVFNSVQVGNLEFVMGKHPHPDAPEPYGVWERKAGTVNHYDGEYHLNFDSARHDVSDRALAYANHVCKRICESPAKQLSKQSEKEKAQGKHHRGGDTR